MKLFKNLFTADVGQGRVHVYDSSRDIAYLKLDQYRLIKLDIDGLERGDVIVIEDAHLRERVDDGGKSQAHAFYMDQLIELYENAKKFGITILLFPHKKSPRVRRLAGYDTSIYKNNKTFMDKYGISTDEADIRSIAKFLLRDEEAFKRLKKFKPVSEKEYHKQIQHKHDFLEETNNDLNIAKTQGYGFDNYYDYGDDDAITQFIKNQQQQIASNLIGDGIFDLNSNSPFTGEELMSAVGLEYGKNKTGKLNAIKSPNRLYTIIASILRPNGDLRTRRFPPIDEKTGKPHKYYSENENGEYTGKELPPQWHWVKDVYFGCVPFHEKQGVGSSNYKFHMRPGISKFDGKCLPNEVTDDQYIEFKEERTIADKKTQQIWYVLRKMIVEDGLR